MKSKLTTLLLCLFLGVFGAHRFYVRKFGTGILYLCTGGLFGVGFFVDLFSIIFNKFTDKDGNTLNNDITSVPVKIFLTFIGCLFFILLVLINLSDLDSNNISSSSSCSSSSSSINTTTIITDTITTTIDNNEVIKEEIEEEKEIEYIPITVKQLYDELHNNALRAERTYQDSYIVINGKLKTIDSNGEYISIADSNDSWNFDDLLCDIKNEKQIDKIMELNRGDDITIYCKIVSIGEILGYKADIINIQ